MVVMMKLKNVGDLSGGRKRFRRRNPKAAELLSESFFQVPMKAAKGPRWRSFRKPSSPSMRKSLRKPGRRLPVPESGATWASVAHMHMVDAFWQAAL